MGYRINKDEPLESGFQRIVAEQMAEAAEVLLDKDEKEDAVHEARRRFKKVRAVWRLLRDQIGSEEYRRRNIFFRDQARHLASMRDATALLESLDFLEQQFLGFFSEGATGQFREWLESHHQAQKLDRESLEAVAHQLTEHQPEILDFSMAGYSPEIIARGITRVYRRGHRALEQCEKSPSEARMHEWRKRAKYLRYHYQLLEFIWQPIFNPTESEFHRLTDLLGQHHDLAMLKEKLESARGQIQETGRQALLALAERQQHLLYQDALQLGHLLYAETPDAFAERMEAYLEVGLGEA